LKSLSEQSIQPAWVGVCDQSSDDRTREVASGEEFPFPITFLRSSRGASVGRNAVASLAPAAVTHLIFPNDTSVYEREFVRMALSTIGSDDVLAVTYQDTVGPRTTFAPGRVRIDRRSAWIPIEPATVIRRDSFEAVGGFNEDLGTGASTPWQSCGCGDLMLRLAASKDGSGAAWLVLAPAVRVIGVVESAGLTAQQRRWKMRAYGRGYGHVLRTHRYPVWKLINTVFGAASLAVREHRRFDTIDSFHTAVGRFEGVTGLVLGSKGRPAVEK
jgi:hypothetical protein